MNRKTIIIILLSVFIISFSVFYMFSLSTSSLFNDDSCQELAVELADRIKNNEKLTEDVIVSIIKGRITNSVINGKITREGKPKDWNGNDFIIEIGDSYVTISTQRSFWQPVKSSYKEKTN